MLLDVGDTKCCKVNCSLFRNANFLFIAKPKSWVKISIMITKSKWVKMIVIADCMHSCSILLSSCFSSCFMTTCCMFQCREYNPMANLHVYNIMSTLMGFWRITLAASKSDGVTIQYFCLSWNFILDLCLFSTLVLLLVWFAVSQFYYIHTCITLRLLKLI